MQARPRLSHLAVLLTLVLGVSLVFAEAPPAQANWWWDTDGGTTSPEPDSTGCSTLTEPQYGLYTVQKCYEVWRYGNSGNPLPVKGNFTYVYTITNEGTSVSSIIQFQVQTPNRTGAVTQATSLTGDASDVLPSSIDASTPGRVDYDFASPLLAPGQTSAPLVIVSPFGPGTMTDNMVAVSVTDNFSLTTQGTCVGPSTLPNPVPCGPFFWALRALNSFFVSRYFPDGQFDQVANFAAANSGGVYATASDVEHGLFTGFIITPKEAAEQQLSALLLNIGAGELFPANTKCRLFLDTGIDTDGDGVADTTVGEQLVVVESDILAGDLNSLFEARNIADSINDGRGLINATQF